MGVHKRKKLKKPKKSKKPKRMAIQRTARGTASDKTSGTTLTIPSLTVPAGHCLVVSAGYDNAQTAPLTVVHGGRSLRLKVQRDNAANGFHASMWIKGGYKKNVTGTVVLTWASAIGKRAAAASSYNFTSKSDGNKRNLDADSTSPDTGLGETMTQLALVVANFVSEGPSSDHVGHTADTLDAGTFQTAGIGQKVGTTGAAPISNITVIETWLELTSTQASRSRLQGATNRNWISQCVALITKPESWQSAIAPSDIEAVEQLISDAGGNPDDAMFSFSEETGLWEAYEQSSKGTLRATRPENSTLWGGV
jgi:hypothetical protein